MSTGTFQEMGALGVLACLMLGCASTGGPAAERGIDLALESRYAAATAVLSATAGDDGWEGRLAVAHARFLLGQRSEALREYRQLLAESDEAPSRQYDRLAAEVDRIGPAIDRGAAPAGTSEAARYFEGHQLARAAAVDGREGHFTAASDGAGCEGDARDVWVGAAPIGTMTIAMCP